MIERFERIREPFGLWTVLDAETGRPAEPDGRELIGLGEAEARAMVRMMNVANDDGQRHALGTHFDPFRRRPSRFG